MNEKNKILEKKRKSKDPFRGQYLLPLRGFEYDSDEDEPNTGSSRRRTGTGSGESPSPVPVVKVPATDPNVRNVDTKSLPSSPVGTGSGTKSNQKPVPTPGKTSTNDTSTSAGGSATKPLPNPASEEEVVEWIYGDLSLQRGDDACWENLSANMWWYAGVGAFAAMTAWPILSPLRRPLQFWNYPREVRDFIRYTSKLRAGLQTRPFHTSLQPLADITKRVLSYLGGIFGSAPKGLATTISGLWRTGAGGIVGTLTSAVGPDKASRLKTSLGAAAGGSWDVVKGSFLSFKGIGTALLAIAILVHLFRGGNDSDEAQAIKKIEDWEGLINGVIDGTLLSEAAIEAMLVGMFKGMNPDFETKCFWENTLRATATILLYYGAVSTGQPRLAQEFSGLQNYSNSLRVANSADEVLQASKAFHRTQIDDLTARIQKILPSTIDDVQSGLRNTLKGKINFDQQNQYIKVLLESGPKAGNNYLKSLGIDKKLRKTIHSASVQKTNELSKAFVNEYRDMIISLEKQTGARTKLRERADQMKNVNNTTLRSLRQAIETANKGTAASSKLLSAAKLSKKNGLSLASKGVKGDLKTLRKLSDELDAVLYAGGDPLKIVKIYRNNMIPLLNRNANNLDNLITSQLSGKVKNLSRLNSSQIAAEYVKNLSAINKASKKSGFFEAMVKASGSENLGRSLIRGKSSKLLNAQLSAGEITRILSGQVLKANRTLRPKDVARLEKQLLIFHKNINTAVVKVWKIPGFDIVYGRNQLLLNSAVTAAITSSVIYYLFSQLSVEKVEIEDIDNWRSCNLVKALIWEEYKNGYVASATKYISGKEKIYVPQYAIDSESESIKTLYEYLYKPEYQTILSKFLNEFLFNSVYLETEANLPKAVLEPYFKGKDAEDFNDEFISGFLDLTADHMSNKDILQSLMQEWGDTIGSDRVADKADDEGSTNYRNKYFPIFIKLLIYNSNIKTMLEKYRNDPKWRSWYNELSFNERINALLGRHPEAGRVASIYTFSNQKYQEFGERCVRKEMKRKTLFSVRETRAQFADGETLDYTSISQVVPWKELFWNRILYALKPGEFYGSEEERAVQQVTDEQAKKLGANRANEAPQPKKFSGVDSSKYKNLDFSKRKHLSMLDCYKLLKKHQPARMRDKYTEEDIYVLAAIGGADALESSGNTRAFNPRVSGKDWSYGLWQINMHGSLGPNRRRKYDIENKQLFNPEINVKVAWDLFLDGVRIADNLEKDPDYINRLSKEARKRFAPAGEPNKFGHWSVAIKTRKSGVKYRKLMAAAQRLKKQIESEDNTMKETNLRDLVSNLIKENYGTGYTPYPYHSHIGQDDEPSEDFIQDWKDFELALVRDESRDTAIRVAKILIRDLELFGDVLDLVGKNQSVATEILKNLRKNEENS